MKSESFKFPCSDGVELYVRSWAPDGAAKASVLIAHGVAEHGARYERLATALVAAGYAVWAPDHRGHGLTAKSKEDLGYLADHDGFMRVVDDLRELAAFIKGRRPGKLFLLGHSLGSLFARAFMARDGKAIDGCVLSAPVDGGGELLVAVGGVLAAIGCAFKGRRAPAPLLDGIVLGANNKPFEPARTKVDWVSSDAAEVDKYVADPLCGFVCSYGFYADSAKGTRFATHAAASIPRNLPIYLFAGAHDPLGAARGLVNALRMEYGRLGIVDVESRIYPDGRHEMLNETNRDEVTRDLVSWLDKRANG